MTMNHLLELSSLDSLHTTTGVFYLGVVLGLLGLIAVFRRLLPVFFIAVFPATLAHELMHLGVALLLNGRPAGFRFIPQRSADGYILGAVRCANVRWYNGLFIGLAPVIWLPVALALLNWRVHDYVAFHGRELLWVYAIACLVYAAMPSWQDIKVALASAWPFVISTTVVVGYYWMQ